MTISVFDKEDKFICVLDNEDALLGSYPINDGMRLHVSNVCTKINVLSLNYCLTNPGYAFINR